MIICEDKLNLTFANEPIAVGTSIVCPSAYLPICKVVNNVSTAFFIRSMWQPVPIIHIGTIGPTPIPPRLLNQTNPCIVMGSVLLLHQFENKIILFGAVDWDELPLKFLPAPGLLQNWKKGGFNSEEQVLFFM